MKLNAPIGNAAYGAFLLRIAIGSYLFLAGLRKLENLNAFVHDVQQFKLLREPLATLYGILIPYLEVAAGLLIVLGFYTTLAALVGSLILATFVYAFGVQPTNARLFNKEIILLASCLSLLWSGPGAFSIDKFRSQG